MRYVSPLLTVVLLFGSLSLWGCTQQKTGAISARIQDLETRYAKLDEDYRALQGTHDQNRKRLVQAESQRAVLEKQKGELAKQLDTVETERDALRKQLSQRTTERDVAHTNLLQ